MKHKTGRCGCGQITYAFSNEPINTVFCYCKQCQIHTGSDKWFGVWVQKANFVFMKGIPSVYSRTGDSGQETKYHFCQHCGTTVCAEVVVGNFYSLSASTLDKADDLVPAMLIYTAYAPKWATIPQNIPAYDILPPFLSVHI
jgi:hypothetical protein